MHADPVDPMHVIDRGGLLTDFDQATAETLLAQAGPGVDCPQLMVEIRQLGGRYAEPPVMPTRSTTARPASPSSPSEWPSRASLSTV